MKGHWKFLGEEVVLKAKILEAKYEAKLQFPGRRGKGYKTKNHLWGEYGYFCLCKKIITTSPTHAYISVIMQILERRKKETQMFLTFPQYLLLTSCMFK